jgi:hypothetical protein
MIVFIILLIIFLELAHLVSFYQYLNNIIYYLYNQFNINQLHGNADLF